MNLGRPQKRLYTEDHFENKMPEVTKPEIERSPLAHVIMQLLAARVKNIRKFEFLDRPPEDAIKTALNELKILGVSRDIGQNELELTDLGLKIGSDKAMIHLLVWQKPCFFGKAIFKSNSANLMSQIHLFVI